MVHQKKFNNSEKIEGKKIITFTLVKRMEKWSIFYKFCFPKNIVEHVFRVFHENFFRDTHIFYDQKQMRVPFSCRNIFLFFNIKFS